MVSRWLRKLAKQREHRDPRFVEQSPAGNRGGLREERSLNAEMLLAFSSHRHLKSLLRRSLSIATLFNHVGILRCANLTTRTPRTYARVYSLRHTRYRISLTKENNNSALSQRLHSRGLKIHAIRFRNARLLRAARLERDKRRGKNASSKHGYFLAAFLPRSACRDLREVTDRASFVRAFVRNETIHVEADIPHDRSVRRRRRYSRRTGNDRNLVE